MLQALPGEVLMARLRAYPAVQRGMPVSARITWTVIILLAWSIPVIAWWIARKRHP